MVIDKLLNAIAGKFIGAGAAAALTTAFGGRYFREEAEGSPAFPYVVAELAPSMPVTEHYGTLAGGAQSHEPIVIFKVISTGHNASAAHASTLMSVFDDLALTLTGGTQIGVWREGEPAPLRLGEDEDGNDVWQWAVMYRYAIQ